MRDGTVFVIDDDEAVRDSLAALLDAEGFASEAFPSGDAFLDSYRPTASGCILLDIRMPKMDGLKVQEKLSELAIRLPVIFISGHGDVRMAVRAIKAGAVDFIEKPFSDDDVIRSVREALKSQEETLRAERAAADFLDGLARLTAREREVFDELIEGWPNKSIAAKLGISPRTVEVHRARIMEKTQARGLSHLIRLALAADPADASRVAQDSMNPR